MHYCVFQKVQFLNVREVIYIRSSLQFSRRVDHRLAEVYTQHIFRPPLDKHPAELHLATAAVEYPKTTNVSTGLHHRVVEKSSARRVSSLASLLYPCRRQLHPFLSQLTSSCSVQRSVLVCVIRDNHSSESDARSRLIASLNNILSTIRCCRAVPESARCFREKGSFLTVSASRQEIKH